VECFPLFEPGEEPGWGNMVVLAYDFPAPARREYPPLTLTVHPELFPLVARFLRPAHELPAGRPRSCSRTTTTPSMCGTSG